MMMRMIPKLWLVVAIGRTPQVTQPDSRKVGMAAPAHCDPEAPPARVPSPISRDQRREYSRLVYRLASCLARCRSAHESFNRPHNHRALKVEEGTATFLPRQTRPCSCRQRARALALACIHFPDRTCHPMYPLRQAARGV
jgi:hypothetical protein